MHVNPRMRMILAGVCAALAGLLTVVVLGNRSGSASDAATIWVAREAIPVGTKLSAEMINKVQVDGPTQQLLAKGALPASATEQPETWFAAQSIAPGEALVADRNVSQKPVLAKVAGNADMRLVMVQTSLIPPNYVQPGALVDLYVMPGNGPNVVKVLTGAPVAAISEGTVTLLVEEKQVGQVLSAITTGKPMVIAPVKGAGS